MAVMPSLNVSFTDEELEAVRTAAAKGDISLRTFAHRAILEAASEHKRRVAEAARIVAAHSAELNRRLA
jgi:molybdenum cofactor biosynthesis enzyme